MLPNNDGFYTFNQVIILEKLALIEVQNDDSTSLNKLQNILLNTKKLYSISEDYTNIATTYANVANLYTKLKDLDNALITCNKGIEFSKIYNVTYNLHYLYYFKAYCLFHTGQKDEAMRNLSIVISLVYAKEDKKLFNYFMNYIEKEFNTTKTKIINMLKVSIENF